MNKVGRIFIATCATLALAAVAVAAPAAWNDSGSHSVTATIHQTQSSQSAQQMQSVSGTIATVNKTSFTLNVTASPSPKAHSFVQEPSAKTMTFQIDKNTTVDGTLKVNASAEVTYRTDSTGNNIAINVHVTPAA
ncbi:MAG TPA: hypothetical protein VJR23_18800 [Candidatus Acidoferrales bacterium]|nr:hypothetical protein [Candidatus Acidoferrales bacterium]